MNTETKNRKNPYLQSVIELEVSQMIEKERVLNYIKNSQIQLNTQYTRV